MNPPKLLQAPDPLDSAPIYKQMTKIFVFHDRDWEDRGTGAIYFILKNQDSYYSLNEYDLDRLLFHKNKDQARQLKFDRMDPELRKEHYDLTGLNEDTKHRLLNQKSGTDQEYLFDMDSEVSVLQQKMLTAYKGPKMDDWEEEDDDLEDYLDRFTEDPDFDLELPDPTGAHQSPGQAADLHAERNIKANENDIPQAETTGDRNDGVHQEAAPPGKELSATLTPVGVNETPPTDSPTINQPIPGTQLTKEQVSEPTAQEDQPASDPTPTKADLPIPILPEEHILYSPLISEKLPFQALDLPFQIINTYPKPLHGDLFLLVIKSENQQAPKRPDSDISRVLQGELHAQRSVLMWYDLANIHNIDPPYNNIIEWHNKDSKGMKMAISFLSQDRCLESYHFICKAAGIHTKPALQVVSPACDLALVLRELKSEASDVDSIKQLYTRGVSRHMRGIRNEYLYSLHYQRADRLACLAQIFKYFVFLSDMDLVLPLISDEHHVMFFTCLNYLPENREKQLDFRDFFIHQAGLVNILNINSPDILNLINNRFRIIFMKDFVFSVSLNEELLQHYNIFLIMNGTTLLQHLVDNDCKLFSDLDRLVHKKVGQMSNFFGEFFFTIKHHFMQFEQLKMKFAAGLVTRGVVTKLVGLVVTHLTRIRYLEKMLDYIELDGKQGERREQKKNEKTKTSGLKRIKRESLKHKIKNPYLTQNQRNREEPQLPQNTLPIQEEEITQTPLQPQTQKSNTHKDSSLQLPQTK